MIEKINFSELTGVQEDAKQQVKFLTALIQYMSDDKLEEWIQKRFQERISVLEISDPKLKLKINSTTYGGFSDDGVFIVDYTLEATDPETTIGWFIDEDEFPEELQAIVNESPETYNTFIGLFGDNEIVFFINQAENW